MDYAVYLKKIIRDMNRHIPDFRSIDVSRIVVSSTASKGRDKKGLWACVLPLRFEDGKKVKFERKGAYVRKYSIKLPYRSIREIHSEPRDHFLYFMYFSTPRFYNLTFHEKVETLIHELYHIHPDFNGDLRRFPGSSYMHGRSMKEFDAFVKHLKRYYLHRTKAKKLLNVLALNQSELRRKFSDVSFARHQEPEEVVRIAKR